MLDAVGDAINKADSLLGGGAKQDAPAAKPVYRTGEPLGDAETPAGGSVGTNVADSNPNAFDTPPQIEFIHYARVHSDNGRTFPHPSYLPNDQPPAGRAIMFREALEREATLLYGFISSCKTVLAEYQSNRGPLGQVGAVADMLMGSGSQEPSPDDADKIAKKAAQAGGTIKGQQIEYPTIHKAGMDLNQARADFGAFADSLKAKYVTGDSSGPGAQLMSIPGAVKGVLVVQKIIFKVFDIYLAMYLAARAEYEAPIEEASYQMTLKAVREKQSPPFPVWFAPEKSQDNSGGNNNGGDDNPLTKAVKSATDSVEKQVKKVEDFFTVADGEPAPGDQQLDAAFAAFTDGGPIPGQQGKFRRKVTDVMLGALSGVIGIGDLPGFVSKVLGELTTASVEMLKVVYTKILKNKAKDEISHEFLMAAGEQYLSDKIVGLFFDLIPFLQNLPSANVQGMTLGKDLVKDKASNFLNDEFAKHADIILDVAMKHLGDVLNDARKAASDDDGLTMEVFLGRLPYALSLVVRDTFFPIWDILVDKVFGAAAGPLGGALSPVKNIIGGAKGVADKAKEIKDKVGKAADQLAQGVNQDNVGSFIDNLTGGGGSDAATEQSAPGFPGSKRERAGEGKNVTKDQIDKVKNEQKVEVTP
ncbi:MAG: hypothetical protein M3268_00515 [Acidobacteriota bacterium]|nr:hypothetical protein [Acidobacteriota bacterium]